METSLKALFRSDQLELAASIGQQISELTLLIEEMFEQLGDPLLSVDDVRALLVTHPRDNVAAALTTLCSEGTLERTKTTSRPLDVGDVELFRLARLPFSRLRLVAIESRTSSGTSRYQFTCDGRLLRSLARVDRLDAVAGTGNQRDEIRRHVERIAEGIASGTQIPNSVLLVLSSDRIANDDEEDAPESFIRIRPIKPEFERITSPTEPDVVIQEYRPVEIDFPYRRAAFDEEKSALLVDGQQRTAALSMVDIDQLPTFSLSVNAEIASSEQAKTVFLVANSTVKIETKFSRALMAAMEQSPGFVTQERPRAVACRNLALQDEKSPFFGLVQYPGVPKEKSMSSPTTRCFRW